jgi:maltose/moltooligosaccharide transporter
MPRSSALWMAAGLLWVLDASINISMQPFRAFVSDLLPESQNTRGFAMQSLFIGLATVIASALPFLLTNVFQLTEIRAAGTIPFTVRVSFYMGAAAFLGAVLWTVFTTKEYPPDNLEEFRKQKAKGAGLKAGTHDILASIGAMPRTMRQLAWVQICTWMGLFCMWLYFPVAVARNVFGAADTNSPLYTTGVEWAGVCFGMYSLVCFGFSFVLPALARKFGRSATHAVCLICGGVGLLSVAVIHTKLLLLFSMVGVGIGWASTLSMPYAILAGSLPEGKTGVYMGIFNSFVVIPEITAALGFGWVMGHLLNNNRIAAVVAGGIFFILAAALMHRVEDVNDLLRPGALPGNTVATEP